MRAIIHFFKRKISKVERFLFRKVFIMLLLTVGLMASAVAQACGEEESRRPWWAEIKAGFSSETSLVGYAEYFSPFDSEQNPDNLLINFPAYGARSEVRNETRLQYGTWEATASPRLEVDWSHWDSGVNPGQEEADHDLYLQYGRLRWNPIDSLFLSYGRENLQWGPSYLYSPSNPFFTDNGKQNPHLEIDGKEFIQAVWLPTFDWTVSLIYQNGNGRDQEDSPYFSKAMALKADFMGQSNSAGVVLSVDEDDHLRTGAFGTGAVGNATVIYGEGAWGYGTNALYPLPAESLFGSELASVHANDRRGFVNLLLGGAYTFKIGPTLTVEYLYYGQGYTPEQWQNFADLRKSAQDAFLANNPTTPFAAAALGRCADPGLRFLRKNYTMLQLHQLEVGDRLDYSMRWVQNMDDGSSRLSATIDLYATDHFTFFAVGSKNYGSQRSEFTSFLDHYAMVGFEYGF